MYRIIAERLQSTIIDLILEKDINNRCVRQTFSSLIYRTEEVAHLKEAEGAPALGGRAQGWIREGSPWESRNFLYF